jgi:virginiamycin A acetyltransferase
LNPLDTLIWLLTSIRDNRRKSGLKFVIPYGKHSYGSQPKILGTHILEHARGSKVGNFCSIAKGLKFAFLEEHDYNMVTTYPFYAFYERWGFDLPPLWNEGIFNFSNLRETPVIIENDVWIAAHVTVMAGVTIHNGAVVAMDSLVTKDVPPYAIVGGRPAKIIKYRFEPNQIAELLKIAWWNWSDEKIAGYLPLLMSVDIERFIRTATEQ